MPGIKKSDPVGVGGGHPAADSFGIFFEICIPLGRIDFIIIADKQRVELCHGFYPP
jgi:hypothetical protein